MSRDFFVAVPSYVSPEFPKNTRSSFKVRLADRLEFFDDDWEVALSAMSMADTSADLSPLVQDERTRLLMSTLDVEDKSGGVKNPLGAYVSMKDMVLMNVTRRIEGGVEFMRAMLDQMVTKENTTHLKNGQTIKERVEVKWDTSRGRPEVIVMMPDGVHFGVDQTLAVNMGWFKLERPGVVSIGPNLVPELTPNKDGRGNSFWKVTPEYAQTSDLIAKDKWTFNTIFNLSSRFDWRFVNLEEAFRNVMGEPSRTFHVYSNAGGSTIVGGLKTDLLREVNYKRSGRGTYYYEPVHKHYHPVRNRIMEIIEIDIAETNGQLVNFPDDGRAQTFVTLHFRRKAKI